MLKNKSFFAWFARCMKIIGLIVDFLCVDGVRILKLKKNCLNKCADDERHNCFTRKFALPIHFGLNILIFDNYWICSRHFFKRLFCSWRFMFVCFFFFGAPQIPQRATTYVYQYTPSGPEIYADVSVTATGSSFNAYLYMQKGFPMDTNNANNFGSYFSPTGYCTLYSSGSSCQLVRMWFFVFFFFFLCLVPGWCCACRC